MQELEDHLKLKMAEEESGETQEKEKEVTEEEEAKE